MASTVPTARKTVFSFSKCFGKIVFPKKSYWNMIVLVLSGKMISLFPENMIWFFRHKRKDDLSEKKKTLKIWFFQQMSWKDDLSKKVVPEHDLFFSVWKEGISFFQKIWYFFFRGKMKEDDLYQKTHGNMMFSVYMRRCYKYAIALLAKKQRYPCPEKIHIRVTSPTSPKKMIFVPENMVFLLKYHTDFENFTGKDLWQSLFLNKVTGLTPATLLALQLY